MSDADTEDSFSASTDLSLEVDRKSEPAKQRGSSHAATPRRQKRPKTAGATPGSSAKKSKQRVHRLTGDEEAVRTIIRLKPEHQSEASCVSMDSTGSGITLSYLDQQSKPKTSSFSFDAVCPSSTTQEQMYEDHARPLVSSFLDGYNATIFAYGQTGSGKTYTMNGELELSSNSSGIGPRSFKQIFDFIDAQKEIKPSRTFECRVSFMQIYNEKISDLLTEGSSSTDEDLRIHETKDRTGTYVADLTEVVCTSADMALELLQKGIKNRKTGKTAMNSESSRSHSVLTVSLTSSTADTESSDISTSSPAMQCSRLYLIDLAGSENQKTATSSSASQFGESCGINLSLTYLGTCLREIVRGAPFVQYRNSKLTMLLKDSLGGNTKTAVICTIGSSEQHVANTHSTLKFAADMKQVRNRAARNFIGGIRSDCTDWRKWKAEAISLDGKVQEQSAQLKQMAKQNEELRTSQVAQQDQVSGLEISLQRQESAMAMAQQQNTATLSDMLTQLMDKDKQIQAHATEIAEMRQLVQEQQQQLAVATTAHSQLAAVVEAARSNKEEEEGGASSQMEGAEVQEAARNSFAAHMGALQQNISSLQVQLEAKTTELKSATAAAAEVQAENNKLKQANLALQQDIGLALKEVDNASAHSGDLASQADSHLSCAQEVSRAQAEDSERTAELAGQLQMSESVISDLEDRCKAAEAELSTSRAVLAQTELQGADMQQALAAAQDNFASLEAELEQERAQRTQLVSKLAQATTSRRIIQAGLGQHLQLASKLYKTVNYLKQHRKALNKLKKKYEAALEKEKTDNKALQTKLVKTAKTFKAEKNHYRTTCNQLQEERDTLIDRLNSLGSQLESIEKTKASLTERAKEAEVQRAYAELQKIEAEFKGNLPLIESSSSRTFLKSGVLKRVSTNNKLLEYNFFLFSDIIIYAKAQANPKLLGHSKSSTSHSTFKLHRVLHLALCRLVNLLPNPKDNSGPLFQHSFKIVSPQKTFIVSCSSPQEKESWMATIVKQMQAVDAEDFDPDKVQISPAVYGTSIQTATEDFHVKTRERAATESRMCSISDGEPDVEMSMLMDWDTSKLSTMTRDRIYSYSKSKSQVQPHVLDNLEMMNDESKSQRGARSNSNSSNNSTNAYDAQKARVQAQTYCKLCVRSFSVFRRKTECKCCEQKFCSDCTNHKHPVPLETDKRPKKVCDSCYGGLTKMVGKHVAYVTVEHDT
eukprot:CAMPEP_0175174016 /NCGR_PEP_ID=MMETSP0087-20121206/32389_1 /TAXON_ID=136419 /ORGANISM="Unknown Unknown, Strain D1" /LENGTH=1217 /DNA_ID=CAMNT_0016465421 /DNA_START=129 /DNA_END=3782 /DNA_ORIENTATION=+